MLLFLLGLWLLIPSTWFFLLVPIFVLAKMFWPNAKKRFLKLQAILPTSTVESMALGLVEVSGTVRMQEPLKAPLSQDDCVAYTYLLQTRTSQSSGNTSPWRTKRQETKCAPFVLEDQGAQIKVLPEGMELVLLPKHASKEQRNQRRSESIIQDGQRVLLIGRADLVQGQKVLKKDPHEKILAMSLLESVGLWNKYKHLLDSFIVACVGFSLLIAFIFMI